MILPRVKHFSEGKGVFRIGTNLSMDTDGQAAAWNLLAQWCGSYAIGVSEGRDAAVAFRQADVRWYTVSVTPQKVAVRYKNSAAARDAAATLVNMAEYRDGGVCIPCGETEDWPDCEYRGFMWDPARKYDSPERLKLLIRCAARAKYNVMHLHLSDDMRYAIRSEAVPALNNGEMRQYSVAEMKEIVAYAASFGIDVLPEVDLPAHAEAILKQMPFLHCTQGGQPIGQWTVCVSEERLYAMLDKLVGELAEIFPYEWMHMGGDELAFFDFPTWHKNYEWDHCDRCKALAEREGFTKVWDYYLYYARRVYAILQKYGKKMVIWNDPLDVSRAVCLPKDIRVQYWRIAAPGRGPFEGCTPEKLLEQGFAVVNSDFPNTYADLYLDEEKLLNWHPRALAGGGAPGQIEGGEICFWDMHAHYEYSAMPSLFLFADRLWNAAPLKEDADAALARQIFGLHPENVFGLLGRRIFPLDREERFDLQKIKGSLQEAEAMRGRLLWLVRRGFGEPELIRPYIYILGELIARGGKSSVAEKIDAPV